ncbi:MAG: restriction endonuclease subunit S [Magnetococcus sp. DMHC-1]
MTLSPYPAYKDSGLPWLGQVPEHWDVLRSKYIFREVDVRSASGEETQLSMSQIHGLVESSKIDTWRLRSESYVGGKLCEPGDLVLNRLKAHLGVFAHAPIPGIVSPDYTVFRRTRDVDVRYFECLYKSPIYKAELRKRTKGIVEGFWRLYSDDFYDIRIAVPPRNEQVFIMTFVDSFNHRVNRIIRNKRRLIALLSEQKQAIINQAVTRGLDPNAPMKATGIDWMPEIPAHWEAKRIKTVTKILRGQFGHRPRNDPIMYDGKFPFIQTGDVARVGKYIIDYKQTLNEKGFAVSKQFPRGTLVMTIAANIGDVAILDFDACFPDSIVGFVPENDVMLDFLFYSFKAMKEKLLKEAPVNTQGNLSIERVGAMPIAIPEIATQKVVVAAIECEAEKINQTIDRSENEIKLIQEYRERLITDVVTGKLDVRGVAVTMPTDDDVIEDLEEEGVDDLLRDDAESEDVEG